MLTCASGVGGLTIPSSKIKFDNVSDERFEKSPLYNRKDNERTPMYHKEFTRSELADIFSVNHYDNSKFVYNFENSISYWHKVSLRFTFEKLKYKQNFLAANLSNVCDFILLKHRLRKYCAVKLIN